MSDCITPELTFLPDDDVEFLGWWQNGLIVLSAITVLLIVIASALFIVSCIAYLCNTLPWLDNVNQFFRVKIIYYIYQR